MHGVGVTSVLWWTKRAFHEKKYTLFSGLWRFGAFELDGLASAKCGYTEGVGDCFWDSGYSIRRSNFFG